MNQRLGMGEVSMVTQAASSENKNEDISLVRIKRELELSGVSSLPIRIDLVLLPPVV